MARGAGCDGEKSQQAATRSGVLSVGSPVQVKPDFDIPAILRGGKPSMGVIERIDNSGDTIVIVDGKAVPYPLEALRAPAPFAVPAVGDIVQGGFWDGAEIISVCAREQLLDDGALVDVSELGREAGYTVPVALTRAVFDLVTPTEGETAYGQDQTGRLWDVLWMARAMGAAQKAAHEGEGRFQCWFVLRNRDEYPGRRKLLIELKVTLDATGEGDPALTVSLPEED